MQCVRVSVCVCVMELVASERANPNYQALGLERKARNTDKVRRRGAECVGDGSRYTRKEAQQGQGPDTGLLLPVRSRRKDGNEDGNVVASRRRRGEPSQDKGVEGRKRDGEKARWMVACAELSAVESGWGRVAAFAHRLGLPWKASAG